MERWNWKQTRCYQMCFYSSILRSCGNAPFISLTARATLYTDTRFDKMRLNHKKILQLVHLLYNLYIYNIFGILLPRKEVDMPKRIHNVKLSEREKEELEKYVKQGKKSARAINRARVLLLANEEKSDDEIIN